MKVGDIFEKDGKTFMVDRLLNNGNYAFHEVPKTQAFPIEEEPERTRKRSRKSGE